MRILYPLIAVVAVGLLSGCFPVEEASAETSPDEVIVDTEEVCLEDPTIDFNLLMCREITIPCGCHGYVEFGMYRRNYRCASGYEQAQPCYGFGSECPYGGRAWGARCTC